MSIYADKKEGKLTGRWRVELQRKGFKTYKKRWDSHSEAVADEKAVLASWDAGVAVDAPGSAPGAPEVHTFDTIIPLAKASMWQSIKDPRSAWAHVDLIAGVIGRTTRLDAVDTLSIDRAIAALQKLGKMDSTINRYLSHFRTFMVWAMKRKYRTIPIEDIEFSWRKETAGRIRWVTADEEEKLRKFLCEKPRDEPESGLALAVWKAIKIAIETGCRRDELLTVEPDQINGTRLHLWKTKTDSPRTVPMSQETTDMLVDLVRSGTMPTQRGLRSWWGRASEALGLQDDAEFVFHITRHTCATRLVDAGINVFVIKEWMGHKRIETSLRYAHVKPQNLEDALVRVGELKRAALENSRNSANNSLPTPHPTGAGIGHFNQSQGVVG